MNFSFVMGTLPITNNRNQVVPHSDMFLKYLRCFRSQFHDWLNSSWIVPKSKRENWWKNLFFRLFLSFHNFYVILHEVNTFSPTLAQNSVIAQKFILFLHLRMLVIETPKFDCYRSWNSHWIRLRIVSNRIVEFEVKQKTFSIVPMRDVTSK